MVFCAWFLLVTVLAATDALHYQHGIGILGLGATVVLPIAIHHGASSARSQQALLAIPLWLLIGVNSIRVLGVYFISMQEDGCQPCSNRGLGRYYRGSHCRAACMVCV